MPNANQIDKQTDWQNRTDKQWGEQTEQLRLQEGKRARAIAATLTTQQQQ